MLYLISFIAGIVVGVVVTLLLSVEDVPDITYEKEGSK